MFKVESFEHDIAHEMSNIINKKAENNDDLVNAVDDLNKASQILDDIGIHSASNKIVEVLASFK